MEPEIQPAFSSQVQDRLSAHLYVYHHKPSQQPFSTESKMSRMLQTVEQAYSRPVNVGEEWTKLDLHWLEGNAGLVVIENLAGKGLQAYPTDEEKLNIAKQNLIVRCEGAEKGFIIRPSCFQCFEPEDHSSIQMCSKFGTMKVNVIVFPR